MTRHRRHDRAPKAVLSWIATGCVVSLAALALVGTTFANATGVTLVASPSGTGTSCSSTYPCSVTSAVAAAQGGQTVMLLGGSYGDVAVRGGKGTATNRITVTSAPGATATFGRLGTYAPYVTWEAVTATVTFYIYSTAVGTTTDDVTLNGAGMFVRSSNITVSNSQFYGGASIDGIQIGQASNVLIEGNSIHDYTDNGTSGYHADCIQMFDSSGITVRANKLRNCYNSGIIFSAGANDGVSNVLIESNFIQGCLVKSTSCADGNTLDLRYTKVSGIMVRNNTFANGSLRLESPGVVFDRNIVGYLTDCAALMTNSIVSAWNTGLCASPSGLGQKGNRQGTVAFVNDAAGDLHVTSAASAEIVPYAGTAPAPTDIDGQPTAPNIAGADTPDLTGSTGGPPDTTPPTVTITSPQNGATVNGTVALQSVAKDNVGVVSVEYLNGTNSIGQATFQSGLWTLAVNSNTVPKGRYSIVARAADAAGDTADSAPVALQIGT